MFLKHTIQITASLDEIPDNEIQRKLQRLSDQVEKVLGREKYSKDHFVQSVS